MARTKKTQETMEQMEFNFVDEETINEIEEANEDIELKIDDGFYDPDKTAVELDGLAAISRTVKASMTYVDKSQIRIIIDAYYRAQANRITLENQIRAMDQGFDQKDDEQLPAMKWMLLNSKNTENQMKKLIEAYASENPVCRWAMATKGIGAIFAALLYDSIDMDVCNHANQFLNYVGLNDNNIPWLGTDKATKIVNEAYTKFNLDGKDKVTDQVLIEICEKTGRKYTSIVRGYKGHQERSQTKINDKTALIKFLAKPPYNKRMKSVVYLIGESFCKQSGKDDSLYGRLYKERKAYETMRNNNLEYREQAERMLREKNYAKNTPTYKCLSQGMLSPGHINQRAKRWTAKIFITHFFEACWKEKYGETKPVPVVYPIAFMGHTDYIEPEVPYSDYI